ncbi:hypothetical protein KY284_001641 [Solanum tuberosum]|nr:hypothetical protein KY284_001641 [Solanum tuberosum]
MLRHLDVESTRRGANFVDVYVVHPISIPLVVEEILVLPSTNADVSSSPKQDNADVSSSPHKNRTDLSSSPQIDRADVCSSQPFDENENRDLNQNQSHLVEDQSLLVEEQAPASRVEEHSDSNSLYDVDENIDDLSDLDEELLQARQSNIQEQVKEKTDRVNLDEIPSGPVGIDVGFEDIYKEMRGRFEGNLGGDDPYFDSSDPGSDISEDEGDPVENDEVVDPALRKESTKIYFDPTAKKGGTANLLYQKGVNIKLKSNEKEMIRAKCNKKGCPWHILGSIDGKTGNFSRDFREEFARLYDYAEQLKTTNPGTTVSIRTSKNIIPGKECLHLALIDVLSNAEIRWCARHIWANWKKDWRGEGRRIKFWQVARASFEPCQEDQEKHRRKDSDEPDKKKFGKATRKGRKIKSSACKTFGHNKKRCLTLKNDVVGTSLISARRPINASSCGVRLATALASGGRPTSATSSDVRQLSTQQSTSSAAGQKRKTSTTLRGGATLAYKKPRPKKAKTSGYGLLFGSGGSVTERYRFLLFSHSGNTDRVLHSATLSSSTPTNIDLGYKPNGLRWKGCCNNSKAATGEEYRNTQGTH